MKLPGGGNGSLGNSKRMSKGGEGKNAGGKKGGKNARGSNGRRAEESPEERMPVQQLQRIIENDGQEDHNINEEHPNLQSHSRNMEQLREPLPMNFDDEEDEEEHAMRILQNEPSEGRPIETINGLNLENFTVNRRNRLQQYN